MQTRKQERAATPEVSVYPGTGTVLAEVGSLEQLLIHTELGQL